MKLWQESADVSGAPVMMMRLSCREMETDPYRKLREQKQHFDGTAPIFEHSLPRTQEVLFTQRLTGEIMLRKIEKMLVRCDELGIEQDREVECPHRDQPKVERRLTYLGAELAFCEQCHDLVMIEWERMNDVFKAGRLMAVAAPRKRENMERFLRFLNEMPPLMRQHIDYGKLIERYKRARDGD